MGFAQTKMRDVMPFPKTKSWSLIQQGLKHCNRCQQIKPHADFASNRSKWDGLNSLCRDCDRARRPRGPRPLIEGRRAMAALLSGDTARLASRTDAQADAAFAHLRLRGKRCAVCRDALPRDAFARDTSLPDGRAYTCTTCSTSAAPSNPTI